jgi:hypothetical protein
LNPFNHACLDLSWGGENVANEGRQGEKSYFEHCGRSVW